VILNETQLNCGVRCDGCIDEEGIVSGIEGNMQVALLLELRQYQGELIVT